MLSYRVLLKIMDDLAETIIAQATDPKVAFMAAAVFGLCLYKLMTMANRKNPQPITEDSDETDDDGVVMKTMIFL